MKTLVIGWFSFDEGHATAGDLRARDMVCQWLSKAGYSFDCANVPPFGEGVDWRKVDPQDYARIVFVCGPFGKSDCEAEFFERFAGCSIFGVDLSMLERLEEWNPFDVLIERDSTRSARPDIVFGAESSRVPVVGLCLVEPYERGEVATAYSVIRRLVDSREMAVVDIDTRLDRNSTGLRSPDEVESLIARMDVLITTRLHGLVFALKNGVPALVIDVEPGGAKLLRQARTIGWPTVFTIDSLSEEALQSALEECLSEDARRKAQACGQRAAEWVGRIGGEFLAAMTNSPQLGEKAGLRRRFVSEHRRKSEAVKDVRRVGSVDTTGIKRAARLASRMLPPGVRRRIRSRWNRPRPVRWGSLRRLTPVARDFFDRGLPVDRYYIERFLDKWNADVHGIVLEIADPSYTWRFGGSRVVQADVLHAVPGNPEATFVGDLATGENIPTDKYDCIILTQTLLCIFDVQAAIRNAHRALKPGGVLLLTVPGISQICRPDYDLWGDFWRFTALAMERLLKSVFGDPKRIRVEAHGNVLIATAFLHNLAVHEFRPQELNFHDPDYQLLITARAVKARPAG